MTLPIVQYLYGLQPVLAALRAPFRKIKQLLLYTDGKAVVDPILNEIIRLSQARRILTHYTTKSQLYELCGSGRPHQNVALQVVPLSIKQIESPLPASKLCLLVADVVDPQNLGSILRSAFFYGLSHIYLTRGCGELSPIVSKASAGSMEMFADRIFNSGRGRSFVQAAREKGFRFVAAHCRNYDQSNIKLVEQSHLENTVLVIGNEGDGIPKSILEQCEYFVTIPGSSDTIQRGLDSLNVGVATGILLDRLLTRNNCNNITLEKQNLLPL